ncbi:MAG: PhzF family phenazine biosynthesis protein [Acidobacteria bacterium]|nr:MAG: PhzF family phenazine biosynthesis protein [Acidobacteriota bacterium]
MTAHPYLHLDVFTERPFEGNQLAVFPDAREIPERWMQPIAREMAFSETVFFLPPVADTAHKKIRIFTPGRELPLAGHPTIGSAFVWAKAFAGATRPAEITLELGVGPIRVTLDWSGEALRFAWMHQPTPEFSAPLDAAASAALAKAMHVPGATPFIAPPQIVSSGVKFLFAPLPDPATVDACVPDAARLDEFFAATGVEPTGVFLFSRSDRADATLYSRMFGAAFGIPEDPATGGASGPLGAYALATGIVTAAESTRLVSLQGAAMGRPSYIHIGVTGTRERIETVRIGGTSRFVAEGVLTLP